MPVALVIILFGFVLLFLVTYRDLRLIRGIVSSGFKHSAQRLHRKGPTAWTSLGKAIFFELRSKSILSNGPQSASTISTQLLESEAIGSTGSINDEKLLYQHILGLMQNRLCAQFAALASYSGGGKISVTIAEGGEKRIEAAIARDVSDCFLKSSEALFGLRGIESQSLQDFTPFGIASIISFPFRLSSSEQAILWFGFVFGNSPNEATVMEARELARLVEEKMSSLIRLKELEDRITVVETENKEKSSFIANVSHDIRSPLNNIRAILQLLKEEFPETSSDMIEAALSNCEGMSEIVETILDYASHKAGKLSASPEPFSLDRIAAEVGAMYEVSARMKGVTLKIIENVEEVIVRADRRQSRRVISNLIGNAVKYTPHGIINVKISREQNGFASVSVQDTGIGMTDSQIGRLFTPFVRFQAGATEGVGLGLALSRVLVELNGGSMAVASKIGEGSVFKATFPTAGEVILLPRKKKPGNSLRSRVLVIDDDVDCVKSLGRVLTRLGYSVTQSITEADALSLINYERPDAIITDDDMPGGGGRRILEYIKEQNINIPTAILSGKDGEQHRAKYLGIGASALFLKPASISELEEWLHAVTDPELKVAS